ncbi:hypothetical protein [Streptomyces xanthii]|nr:hypothetical protein [Streptomyces xanthii]
MSTTDISDQHTRNSATGDRRMNDDQQTHDTGVLLEAGAVLLPGTHRGEDADELTVRAYEHPVLEGRTVVRLVPGTLGDAEDLALDFLGLTRTALHDGLGQVRRETLGFPAWALVHDPANGHHALALVKDVERFSRMAKSRAGAAKEGFEALGERLGRSVPHFLPTFYEEAGRAFLRHENTTYAAQFFGKAREAERVHSLTVDEARQRAVFLEFAFAGALTVKALKEHVADLTARLSAEDAWLQYRQLVVERCGAGMPPYAALPQDARKLIKAAGLDRVTEETALLADLLASPAVVRAPASFWTAYQATLVVLAKERPEVRARLLEFVPTGLGRGAAAEQQWLGLLTESGAEELLTGPAAGAEVSASDWLTRWAAHLQGGYRGRRRTPLTYALVERMAPRLIADGSPVDLDKASTQWASRIDLDLLDLCLALGVPVTDPRRHTNPHSSDRNRVLGLGEWLDGGSEGRRDLAALAADEHYGPLLRADVGHSRWNDKLHLRTVVGHPVLRGVLSTWLDERTDAYVAAAGLPGAEMVLNQLNRFRAVAAEVNPEAVDRVRRHDLSRNLARTLRAGLFDELGWPALEEAMHRLGPAPKENGRGGIRVTEAWPALIVSHRDKAVVAGPDGVLAEHDLRVPKEADRWTDPAFRYVDGDLLVMWREDGRSRAYWTSRPGDVFALSAPHTVFFHHRDRGAGLPLPAGGRTTGRRPLHAGDTQLTEEERVIGDGTGHWRLRTTSAGSSWIEYDAATGAVGRASLPAFFAAAVRDGSSLRPADCELLPMQPGLEETPLGTDGTVLGRWVRSDGDTLTAGTPDGTTVTLPDGLGAIPVGALRLPGSAPVLAHQGGLVALYEEGATKAAGPLVAAHPGSPGGRFAAGTVLVPPLPFWHLLRVRDEAGSKALRDCTDELAASLVDTLAGIMDEHIAATGGERSEEQRAQDRQDLADATSAAVARALPGITDFALLAGVTSVALVPVGLRATARRYTDPEPAGPSAPAAPRPPQAMYADFSPEHGGDTTLLSAVRAALGHTVTGYWSGDEPTVLRHVKAVNDVLGGTPAHGPAPHPDTRPLAEGWTRDPGTVPSTSSGWPQLLDRLPVLATRAAAPSLFEGERAALLHLFEAVAAGPLGAGGGTLRVVRLREPLPGKNGSPVRRGEVHRQGERTLVFLEAESLYGEDRGQFLAWRALEHDPSGVFGAVGHFTVHAATPVGAGVTSERLTELATLLRTHGPAQWDAQAVDRLAAAPGCGPAQAALLLTGRPTGTLTTTDMAECRELTGLTRGQIEDGEERLRALPFDERCEIAAALLPEDLTALWRTGLDTDAAHTAWTERFGTLVRLPEGGDADVLDLPATEAVLNPARQAWLTRTTTQRLDENGRLRAEDSSAVPNRRTLTGAVEGLATLAYGLPYGHPLRARLPEGLDALRERLADPGLLLDADLSWAAEGRLTTAARLRKAYGMPEAGGAEADGMTRAGTAFVLHPWYAENEGTLLRPAGLTGTDDPAVGLAEGIARSSAGLFVRRIAAVRGDELARTLAADGGFEGYAQDPARSVPELVTEVAETHGIGADAAALYLQLLALPDPTDRNVARWTGWKPARLKKARAELAATDLVVEAKRARAGRALFLPGGWLALKSPALPVEAWKSGLYPVPGDSRAVPMLPVPELFAVAWQRVRSGDVPAYEELTTRATSKGRRRG